jgi:hypothetical protein
LPFPKKKICLFLFGMLSTPNNVKYSVGDNSPE